MRSSTFLTIIAFLAGPYLLAIGYFTITQQEPFDGDLTRVSALSEADYGWNEPQDAYKADYNFPTSRSIDAYDKPFDIVVAGDSFSFRRNTSWINTLIEQTGMSALALHVNGTSVSEIIRHPMFQNSPPKYFIFESVERRLYDRLELLDIPARTLTTDSQAPSSWRKTNLERQSLSRIDQFATIEQRFAQAVHVVRVKLSCLIDEANCKVVTRPLRSNTPRLFSSREQRRIALLKKDYSSRAKWEQRRPEALRRLQLLNDYFAAAPNTKFVLLIFPDKLTVYSEFLKPDHPPVDSLIPEVSNLIEIPRLDLAYKSAIGEGQLDIYLPNNSHSSGWANILAGKMVGEHLSND